MALHLLGQRARSSTGSFVPLVGGGGWVGGISGMPGGGSEGISGQPHQAAGVVALGAAPWWAETLQAGVGPSEHKCADGPSQPCPHPTRKLP